MKRVHTAETLRIQRRLERLELDHLRALAAEQAEQLEAQQQRIAELERDKAWLEDVAEWQHRETLELGHRMEEAGTGHLGLTMSGSLVVIGRPLPELGLSS
jgi:hypothetical protein